MSIASVEVLGIVAITIMVSSYALEERSTFFVASFSFGCALAAVYALLIASYPFLVAESLWSVIAYSRWRKQSRAALGKTS